MRKRRARAQSLLEYVLLMSAVVVGIVLAYGAIKDATNTAITNTAAKIANSTSGL